MMKGEYTKRTGLPLIITDFNRTAPEQARMVRKIIRKRGIAYVLDLYRHSPAIREIVNVYLANRRRPQKALARMTITIQNQIAQGIYVSEHLRGRAVDIRSRGRNGARLSVLRAVAHKVGAKVSVEPDHVHVRLV
jgi:hypothetical protein